jgi:hypothetical protein
MFGFGKKHVPAKAVAKPRTGEESIAVRKALREKYPQMFEPGWGVAKAIKKARGKTSSSPTVAEHRASSKKSLEGALSGEEIARLSGKKKSK